VTATTPTHPAVPARRRPTTWLALALLALALGMVGFVWLSMLLPGEEKLDNRPASAWELATLLTKTLAYVALLTVGATLAVRRPVNPVGWTLLLSGFGFVCGAFAPEYVGRSVLLGSDLPAADLVDWLGYVLEGLGFLLLVTWLPMHFPDGRLPGRRWQVVAWATAVFIGCAGLVLLVNDRVHEERVLPSPVQLTGTAGDVVEFVYDVLVTPALFTFIGLAFASVVARFRRSGGVERLQIKWFLTAVALLATTTIGIQVTGIPRNGPPAYLAFAFLPIAIGIAILRYRLYDIDRLISRTIGWALVTGILAAVFVAVVLALQALLAGFTQGETLAVAASTLAAFALFQPLRRRIQVAVDRRFDRARYDGQQTVDAFAERLRDEVELASIEREALGTVDETVRPVHAGLWLRKRQEAGQ
jgi:hypothetical protein